MTPQENQVLAHLEQHDHITPLEALGVYGIYRLGARIFNIKKYLEEAKDPRKIITTIVRDPSGKKGYARYSLSPKKVPAPKTQRRAPAVESDDVIGFDDRPMPLIVKRHKPLALGSCA